VSGSVQWGGGGVPLEACGPGEGVVVGRDGSGVGVEATRTGAVCVAVGKRWGDAAFAGAVRGVVRGTGLAAGVAAAGTPPDGGGLRGMGGSFSLLSS